MQKVVDMGIVDRSRVAVGGHSYGAFMTANLLAHAGVRACSANDRLQAACMVSFSTVEAQVDAEAGQNAWCNSCLLWLRLQACSWLAEVRPDARRCKQILLEHPRCTAIPRTDALQCYELQMMRQEHDLHHLNFQASQLQRLPRFSHIQLRLRVLQLTACSMRCLHELSGALVLP